MVIGFIVFVKSSAWVSNLFNTFPVAKKLLIVPLQQMIGSWAAELGLSSNSKKYQSLALRYMVTKLVNSRKGENDPGLGF